MTLKGAYLIWSKAQWLEMVGDLLDPFVSVAYSM